MNLVRRVFLSQLVIAGIVSELLGAKAFGETVQYSYDAHGRLVRASYSNGVVIDYNYDNAGNRTQVVRTTSVSPPPSSFDQTIAITGSSGVNLRSLADAAGYTGAQNATVTFTLATSIAITGAAGSPNGGIAIDTGSWPTSTQTIALSLQISGVGDWGGGAGGNGAPTTGGPGAGGDGIYCRLPIAITVTAGGAIRSGGGGGAGGSAGEFQVGEEFVVTGGGGGGGGFPNGPGGAGGASTPFYVNGDPGVAGTTVGGGAGGSAASPATAGASGGGAGVSAGGIGGFAIRKNGHNVPVTNSGTIVGSVG